MVSDVATQFRLNNEKSNKNGGKGTKTKKYGAQRTVQNSVATPLHQAALSFDQNNPLSESICISHGSEN